jgi:hypothetical protein
MVAKKLPKSRYFVILISIVIGIVLLCGGLYYFMQYQKSQQMLKNPTLAAQVEAQSLVTKVGRLMELPKGEDPTIATVSDITKLKGQEFFKDAQNGFKVLIYAKAKEAILYDPMSNKIVKVAPLNLKQEATASPSASVAQEVIKVALYNGTMTVGLTSTTEKKLKAQFADINVVAKENAKIPTYKKTLVVDLTGKNTAKTAQLAQFLKGEVGTLPVGELKPQAANILVILGKQE